MFRKSVVVLLVGLSVYAVAWATKGDGISAVGVVLKKQPGGSSAGSSRTNATGNYTFSGVGPGTYSLLLDQPGVKLERAAPASNARLIAPAPINATVAPAVGGVTEITFAGQPYELSVGGQGVTVSDGTIKQTSASLVVEVNISVTGRGTTTVSGVFAKTAQPKTGTETDKQNN